MTASSVDRVTQRAVALGVELDPAVAEALIGLLERLAAEPQNLSSIDDPHEAVDRHLADSLSGLCVDELRSATELADIGSGGGFPGLVLAMFRPECAVTLVESERRKADWLAREAARLPNVRVVAERTETLATNERESWPAVTARAVAPFAAVVELAAPLISVGGSLVVWRGDRDDDDVAGCRAAEIVGLARDRVIPVEPFPGARRTLHVFHKEAATPERFPRRPGRATKRPLA